MATDQMLVYPGRDPNRVFRPPPEKEWPPGDRAPEEPASRKHLVNLDARSPDEPLKLLTVGVFVGHQQNVDLIEEIVRIEIS